MLNYGTLLFSPRGRLRRRLYWRASMILLVIWWVAPIIPRIGLYLGAAFSLVALYGFACLYAKRLHDLGRSGWWQLIGWGVGVGSLFLALLILVMSTNANLATGIPLDPRLRPDAVAGFAVVGTAGFAGLHILLGVLRGQTGANRFGPDPGRPLDMEIFD